MPSQVERMIRDEVPREPCYGSETIRLLKEIQERADARDLAGLTKPGKVHAAAGPRGPLVARPGPAR